MSNSEEFNLLVQEFYSRNHIKDHEEKYIKGFRRRLGRFLSQLDDGSEVKQIILDCIKDNYKYYSKAEILTVLKKFHESLVAQLSCSGINFSECHFSSILNKETYKHNSSNAILNLYIDINELPNHAYYEFTDILDLEYGRAKFLEKKDGKFSHYDDRFYRLESERLKVEWKSRLSNKKYLILIDDYTGSGKTIIDFIILIKKYVGDDIRLIIYCIHATKVSKNTVNEFLSVEGIKGQIESYEESDMYFANAYEKQNIIKSFGKFRNPLGYDETESVLTTYRNTPNNTLELFWNDNLIDNGWCSLFPRDKKNEGSYKFMSDWVKERNKLQWFMTYKEIPEEIRDQTVVLLYVKNNNRQRSNIVEIELSQIICYNDSVMQECQDKNLIELIDNIYKLSEQGLDFLKQLKLNKVTFQRIKKDFMEIGEQKEPPPLRL